MKLGAIGVKLVATKAAAVKTAVVLTGAVVMETGVITTYKIVNQGPDITLAAAQIEEGSPQSGESARTSSNPEDNQVSAETPDIYIPDRQQGRSLYQPPK